MSKPPVSRVIGPHCFFISLLPTSIGSPMLMKLVRVGLPAYLGALQSAGTEFQAAALTFANVLERFSETDLDAMLKAFAKYTQVCPAAQADLPEEQRAQRRLDVAYDTIFAGDYGTMMAWAAACFEVNFASFLSSLKDKLAAQVEKQAAIP